MACLTDEVGQRPWVQVFTRTCDSDVRQPLLLRQLVLVATQGDSYELVAEVVCDADVVPFELFDGAAPEARLSLAAVAVRDSWMIRTLGR
ncbi:hypothetical protein QFZ30_002337 [Arthrobacter pascens]|nr:hypothetical protein [Arthrobacter pascens]